MTQCLVDLLYLFITLNHNILKIFVYVDLDGTFTKTDMLYESMVIALKSNPLLIFMLLPWLVCGKAYLKCKLSERANINTKVLPLNPNFHAFLIEEKSKNRKIILATASNEKYAKSVCNDFDLFDSYISSDDVINLKGEAKLSKIKSISTEFSYAGNSSEDFVLFSESKQSFFVNPSRKARAMALKAHTTRVFGVEVL